MAVKCHLLSKQHFKLNIQLFRLGSTWTGRRRANNMVTDPIADFLTRIRNAQMAGHRVVDIPASNLKKRMTEILYNQGYILKYKFEDDNKQGVIKIALKYDPSTKQPAIQSMERVSSPGLRQYAKPAEFRRVKNGLGVAILSTSKGVMTDKDAKAQNVGGEVLCYIY
jgi:small subunit ribosomal protein S8